MSEDSKWRNLQTAVYLKACELHGIERFDGILWDFVLSKPPTRPTITQKTGTLSIKRVVTLPSVVHKVIKDNDLTMDGSCETAIKRAAENLPRYFNRSYEPRKEDVVNELFDDFVYIAREMAEIDAGERPFRPVRNVDRHCEWCDFELICRTALTGGDVDYVKEKEFTVGERKEKAKDTGSSADKRTR